jgi:cadmium resistance protein CadD (predicted permease)
MMTGTDIQVKINTEAIEITASKYLGKLFLILKSLNFRPISGMFETIR